MTTALTFTVYGVAQPQGSTRAFMPKGARFPVITSANAKLKPWRQEVAAMASLAVIGKPVLSGPIIVKADFIFLKPKSTKNSVVYKTTKPDLDKLIRGLLDSLTGIVFCDDSQVVRVSAFKAYGDVARTEVVVESLP